MNVWITGGAGYVGSAIANRCRARGHRPIVIDDLSSGRREAVPGMSFYHGDFAAPELLRRVAAERGRPDVVVHAAGLVSAGASVREPLAYYLTNLTKTVQLCEFLVKVGCPRLVVESSAAVYGDTTASLIDERAPLDPVSPYAFSKSAVERVLQDAAAADALRVLCFRLFNVVGSGAGPRWRRRSGDVLTRLRDAGERGEEFEIHGTDWPTVDGTAVRDFVHVRDVADAHVRALDRYDWPAGRPFEVLNLATGAATSIRQLIDVYHSHGRAPIQVRACSRRPGDIAGFAGDASRARAVLDWAPRRALSEAFDGFAGRSGDEPGRGPVRLRAAGSHG